MIQNQSINEKEINFKEILFYCLKRWRSILGFMILIAVLAGGYKYFSVEKNNQIKLELRKAEEEQSDVEIGIGENIIHNPNVERYQLSIKTSEDALEKKDDYLKNSFIMQLDANHLQIGTLSFYVELEDDSLLDALVDAYRAYATDGRLAGQLEGISDRVIGAELQDLIFFIDGKVIITSEQTEHYARPQEEDQDTNTTSKTVEVQMSAPQRQTFQIRMIVPEDEISKDYLEKARNSVLEYSEVLQKDIGEHKLKVLSVTQAEQIDQTIQYYQNGIIEDYVMSIENLGALRAALEEVIEREGEMIPVNADYVLGDPVASALKYALVGLVLGAFVIIIIWMLTYIMSNRLQSLDFFEEEFEMKLVACVRENMKKKRWFDFLDNWIWRMEAGAYGNIPFEEQVKIASANVKVMVEKNAGLKSIMLAGTMSKKDIQTMCIRLAEDIKEVIFSDYKQVIFCASDLEEMEKMLRIMESLRQ